MSEDLIDSKRIAEILRCTRKNVTQRVVKHPGFPEPEINYSQKTRRWSETAVLAWLKSPDSRQSRQG